MTSKKLRESEEYDELRLDSERIKEFKKGKGYRFMDEINKTFDEQIDRFHADFLIESNISNIDVMNGIRKFIEYYKSKNK